MSAGHVAVAGVFFALAALWVVALVRLTPRLRRRRVLVAFVVASLALPLYVALVELGLVRESFVRLERPLSSLFAPLAASFVAARLAAIDPAKQGRSRAFAMDLLTESAAVALALAVAGVSLGRPLSKLTVILVVDRSRSIDLVPDAAERIDREIRLAETDMKPGDRIGTVAFGATATTEEPPRTHDERAASQRASLPRDGTDIDAAIRRALADVPPDSAARLVLISDGVATRGDTMSGASAAVAAEVPVDVVGLEQKEARDVRIVSVHSPARGDDGESIDLRVVTNAPADAEVEVRVLADGALVSKSHAKIAAGEDVFFIRQKLEGAGLHRYEVQVSALDPSLDSTPDDNAATAFVRVRGEAAALVMEGDAGKGAFVRDALHAAGFRADEVPASGVPADLGGFAAYDLVVLSDIPAPSLSSGQIEALASYVRDFGGGLLLMGGDRSLGPGGYGKTPIEEVSPVSFDLKQEEKRASLAEVIGIDISGSMGAEVGGRTKLDLANEAAARSAALLGAGDRLGVEHVDTEVHWSVPLGPIKDKDAIDKAIRSVEVGGGGIIVPITMDAGYAALLAEHVNLKHMLLFADGGDAEEIASALSKTSDAKARGITTSVVALGNGKDVRDLEEMSRLGGGRFYLVEDASRLPSVFAQETVLAARSAIAEDPFRVHEATPSPVTEGIDFGEAPELHGYVVTIPKGRATVSLTGPDRDPILATWPAGIGQCGAFTSDLKDRWGAKWTSWPGAARMIGQLGRELERKGDDPRVSLEADASSGELHVRATVVGSDRRRDSFRRLTAHVGGPDGFSREVPLEPMGAGAYASTIPLSRPGTYVAVAKDDASGEAVGATGAVLTTGEELRPTGSDLALLRRIAEVTGGKARDTLEGVFRDRPASRFAYEDATRPLVLFGAFALVAMVGARRLSLPRPNWSRVGALLAKRPEAKPPASEPATMGALLSAKGATQKRLTRRSDERAPAAAGAAPLEAPRPLPSNVEARPMGDARPIAAPPTPARAARSPEAPATPATAGAAAEAPSEKKLSSAELLAEKKRKRR